MRISMANKAPSSSSSPSYFTFAFFFPFLLDSLCSLPFVHFPLSLLALWYVLYEAIFAASDEMNSWCENFCFWDVSGIWRISLDR
jgi:hypothetical protein